MLHELDERVDNIESFLSKLAPGTRLPELRTELLKEYQQTDEGKWLQIVDDQGNWLYFSSRRSVANPIPPLPSGPGRLIPFQPPRTHGIRVYSRQIHAHGHTYFVSTAMSTSLSAKILASFRMDLWLLVPAVLLSALTAGYSTKPEGAAPGCSNRRRSPANQ